MYTGFLLTKESREKLLKLFPPLYKTVLGHHITHQFGVSKDTNAPDMPKSVKVIGHISNDYSIQGLLVEIDGSVKRPDGKKYHITWSLDEHRGAKPVHTNVWVDDAFILPKDKVIDIKVVPKLFDKSTKEHMKKGE